jgi:ABC-type nitrate/sulfonate/bicarbonate transport system permease component
MTTTATTAHVPVTDAPRGSRRPIPPFVLRAIAGAILLVLWQVLVAGFEPAYIARPYGVAKRIVPVFRNTQFLKDIAYTLSAVLEGLAIAAVLGLIIGLVMGRLPDVRRALGMYVNSFYAMPLIALVPLLTVWFGYTPKARLVVVVIEAILPIIYNVSEGAASVSATYLEVSRIHRAPWWRVWLGVVLPSSFPYLLAGIDLAIGRALIGAVVAEFIAAINGLGYFILFDVRSFHEDDAIVALLVLVVFALGLRALVTLVVTRGFRWYRPV